MKKQERKENANKGFSLVELIVVVAIMAVLLVVLTPQYLRYVERTRLQKDNTAIGEIVQTIKLALSDETILTGTTIPAAGLDLTLSDDTNGNKAITFDSTVLGQELAATIGTTYTTSSNTYRESTADIVIHITLAGGIPQVEVRKWIDAVGGPTGTRNFNNVTPAFTADAATP